jgi:transposase
MQPETVTRCYRYALTPSQVQREAIYAAARIARRYWNALVACERYALHEIEHGRRGSIASKLTELLLAKNLTGVAVVKARPRAETDGISLERAAKLNRIDQAQESAKCIYTKKGFFLRRKSNRKLAVAYAIESVEATRKKKGGCESQMAVALTNKFRDCCGLYIDGKRGAPRFKRFGDSISLQYQVTKDAPSPISGDLVRLDKLAGDLCNAVPVILHRPIPEGATIKQVALTIRGERMFAVLMLDIIGGGRQYASTGQVAGIDPGRKMALSLSTPDGTVTQSLQPPLARNPHTLRRLRRLQRKAARQLRIANPACFNADGTFKRGTRPKNKSKSMLDTGRQVLALQEHIANARTDYYHNTANQLLSDYDVVGVGTWRGRGQAPGEGKTRAAQNRKDYDHAISSFVSILQYKADECGKQVFDVPEHGSTKTCSHCGAQTGPTGLDGLKVRQWTCRECGTPHNRDFSAAAEIARRAKEMAAGNAARVASPKGRKKGRRAQAQTQIKIPVIDQTVPARAELDIIKCCERSSGAPEVQTARAVQSPVTERRSNTVLGGPAHQPANGRIPLAAGKMNRSTTTTYMDAVAETLQE